MLKMNACTVTTKQRLPFAKVLARSFLEHHPGATFTVLVVDLRPGNQTEQNPPLQFLSPAQIDVSEEDLGALAMLAEADQLSFALVPRLILNLLGATGDGLLFLSDDSRVYSNLDGIEQAINDHGAVLGRRAVHPFPVDGATPSNEDLLRAGLVDPGFVGVGASGLKFAEWWAESASVESLVSAPGARAILDLAPPAFGAYLLGDPGTAVSFWNLGNRQIQRGAEGWSVGGATLRLFRFEGYDPADPHLISALQGPRPRLLLSERSDLRALVADYHEELLAEGFDGSRGSGFDTLASGLAVDGRMRSLYREALAGAIQGEGSKPPNPFDAEHSAFIDWLNSPDLGGRAPGVPRYLFELWNERLDLQIAFPGIAGADAPRFLEWVVNFGAGELSLAPELLAAVEPSAPLAGRAQIQRAKPPAAASGNGFPKGLNIAGYFQAELGVGEMARLMFSAAREAEIPVSTYSYRANFSRQNHPFESNREGFVYDTNLICVNADELYPFARDAGPDSLAGRYTIGLWWWEVEEFPAPSSETLELVDEIWVGSPHIEKAVSAVIDKPVFVVPIPIPAVAPASATRLELGLPEEFMFLFTFDFLSVFERKNPLGVVEAFKTAFKKGEGPVLVVKSINGRDNLPLLEKLRLAAEGRADIRIIDGYLSADRNASLLDSCDCYVSLHRAEGYGLGMAEAVARGKPVIATRYSGNLTFLNDHNSHLIDFKLVQVQDEAGPYPRGAVWAEPDVGLAAEAMKKVFKDPGRARALGEKARADALSDHTMRRTSDFINERLTQITRIRRSQGGSARPKPGPDSSAAVKPRRLGRLVGSKKRLLGR